MPASNGRLQTMTGLGRRCQRGSIERSLPWLIVLLATIAGISGFLVSQHLYGPGAATGGVQGKAWLLYPQAKALPEFRLQGADGHSISREDWKGSWRLLFFGFANCPDVCPAALASARELKGRLAEDPALPPLAVSFISVDPERDEADRLGAYVAYFDPAFQALTGEPEQLLALTRSVGVVYMKVPTGDGPYDYTIDHSASILLLDPQGRLAGLARPPHDLTAMTRELAELMRSRR